MATTTNFGWETPDDTDLVKDGAAAIRTSLNGVDASFVDLKGGTTGQVLSKASGTDLDFTWVAQDDSNAIQNAIVDAKGDLIVGASADTPARLAVGTNGYVLTANSSATNGVEWAASSAGGFTTIASGTLSGTVTLSSISADYKDLRLIMRNVDMTGDCQHRITVNSVSNYRYSGVYSADNSGSAFGATSASYIPLSTPQQSGSSSPNTAIINFYDYSSSGSGNRMIDGVMDSFTSNAQQQVYKVFGVAVSTSAISSITITPSANSYSSGTYELIGIK